MCYIYIACDQMLFMFNYGDKIHKEKDEDNQNICI